MIKIRAEINEMEPKKKRYKKSMNPRVGSLERQTVLTNL